MNIIEYISNNKEWLFSGVGLAIVLGLIAFFRKKSDLIKVTITGGGYWGPEEDTYRTININEISSIRRSDYGDIGKTIISLRNGEHLYVSESERKIRRLARR